MTRHAAAVIVLGCIDPPEPKRLLVESQEFVTKSKLSKPPKVQKA